MAPQPRKPIAFDAKIVAQLACPACHTALRLEASSLVCTSCTRDYPIVDGIPVLIADRADGAK
jgi:uncharacterized protein YbaR (Trm112 family)